jgi:CheY-like chemotaxis protein
MMNWLGFGDSPKTEEGPVPQPPPTSILLIDDDPDFLATIRPLLATHGFHVYTAASGATGLNILQNGPDDLRVLLLDFKMPTFDGAETLRYVQRVRPGIKVIGVTAVPFDQLPEEFRNGVDKLIFKPFKTNDLVAAIEELVPPCAQSDSVVSGSPGTGVR